MGVVQAVAVMPLSSHPQKSYMDAQIHPRHNAWHAYSRYILWLFTGCHLLDDWRSMKGPEKGLQLSVRRQRSTIRLNTVFWAKMYRTHTTVTHRYLDINEGIILAVETFGLQCPLSTRHAHCCCHHRHRHLKQVDWFITSTWWWAQLMLLHRDLGTHRNDDVPLRASVHNISAPLSQGYDYTSGCRITLKKHQHMFYRDSIKSAPPPPREHHIQHMHLLLSQVHIRVMTACYTTDGAKFGSSHTTFCCHTFRLARSILFHHKQSMDHEPGRWIQQYTTDV